MCERVATLNLNGLKHGLSHRVSDFVQYNKPNHKGDLDMTGNQEQIHMPHDTGYKYLLSSKKAFMQLIRSFIKTGWAEQVDEANLVRIDKSVILQDFLN